MASYGHRMTITRDVEDGLLVKAVDIDVHISIDLENREVEIDHATDDDGNAIALSDSEKDEVYENALSDFKEHVDSEAAEQRLSFWKIDRRTHNPK